MERRIEKTEAASVEPITEPIKRLSEKAIESTKWQKSAVNKVVNITPRLDISTEGRATLLASSQFVPKPP